MSLFSLGKEKPQITQISQKDIHRFYDGAWLAVVYLATAPGAGGTRALLLSSIKS